MTGKERDKLDDELIKKLKKRANKARSFPVNTCGASRHVFMIAENMAKKGGYPMLHEEPKHCALSMLATVAALWEARTELDKLRKKHDRR